MQNRGTWSAGPGDDQARFLADLRALRDSAAIGYDELAARAHFPSDVLKEAENGPLLPGLPILTAYVRACEGDVLDWEERWRRLNPEVADDPNLPVRPAGASAAAVAGARAGISIAPPDVYDPERIRAALRGNQSRSGPGWDAGGGTAVASANGKHPGDHFGRGPFDAASSSIADAAGPAPQPQAARPEAAPVPGAVAAPGAAPAERAPRYPDDGLTSSAPGDFWTKPAALARADLPGGAAQWSRQTGAGETGPAEPARRPTAGTVPGSPGTIQAGTVPPGTIQAGTVPTGIAPPTAVRRADRPDRFFTARLLVVVVIAALIGSLLVLLLK